DVAWGEVGLHLGEVADAPEAVTVSAVRQFGDDDVVILAVGGVEEPHLAFANWPGKRETRVHLVEGESFLVLHRRNKVCSRIAKMVVADTSVEAEDAARAFAVLGGVAGRFDVQRTKRVGTHPHEELPGGRLSDVEAVQQGEGLVRLRPGDVRLPENIVDNPGNKVQRVAVVTGIRVGKVDNVNAGELLLVRDLGGIDGGRGLDHIDYLAHLLLVGESDINVRNIDVRRSAGLDRRQHN